MFTLYTTKDFKNCNVMLQKYSSRTPVIRGTLQNMTRMYIHETLLYRREFNNCRHV